MSTMLTEKVPSGIDILDQAWDGLFRGAAYLLYGSARSGRDLVALQLARTAVAGGEPCVLISPRRPRDLSLQAATIGFDVEDAVERGNLRLLRVPANLMGDADDATIATALEELARMMQRHRPERLVIDDFTPFLRFRSFEHLRHAIIQFLDAIGETDATTVLAVGEPANTRSEEIVAFLRGQTAGSIHLTVDEGGESPTARRFALQPTLGSLDADRDLAWDLRRLVEPATAASRGDSAGATPPAASNQREEWRTEAAANDGNGGTFVADEPFVELSFPTTAAPDTDDAPIHFFDPQEPHGEVAPADDPFALVGSPESIFDIGHYIEGAVADEAPPRPAPLAPQGEPRKRQPVPAAEPGREAPRATFPEPIEAPADLRAAVDRSAFCAAFDTASRELAVTGERFLALALRIDPSHPAAEHFGDVVAAIRETTTGADTLLADASRGRLALVLPGRAESEAQAVFTHLKKTLRDRRLPAAEALRALAAAVVPNGHPFTSGDAFLTYVFNER